MSSTRTPESGEGEDPRVSGPAGAHEELRELLDVLVAVREGDFTVRLPSHWTGLIGKIGDAVNDLVVANQTMAEQLARVGQLVGKEGRTKHRVRFPRLTGAWVDMEGSVNTLIDDLLWPTTEVTRALAAVAQGDLSQTLRLDVDGRPLQGEFLRSASLVNAMIKQLGVFTSEVTRVAREVGTDGKLGGQAVVPGVAGTWKDLTDSVNSMAGNLTAQVRNIAEVATAIAGGDLSRKITVDVRGEILQLKETVNTMVDQLNAFAREVTRVAREVGTEGRLGGQAQVPGVAGTWKALTDSVNFMASNLTAQVRNIAEVTTAVARGDLSRKITVDVKGEILELKETINTMVDQLSAFASEVTRVAGEVGTEGKLGGQAEVPGLAGIWTELTGNVNSMAKNLTAQVRNIAEVATSIAAGDLSKKITVDVRGELLVLKETLNTMVEQLRSFAGEVTRVAREVGTEGRLGGQANVPGAAGTWKDLTDNVNLLAGNLTTQVRNIAEVTTAVARGDLSRKITVDAKGEVLELKNTVNTMVDQLSALAAEVTRVAREVGTDGKLGGQAEVPDVGGTWKDLTDTVNVMAANLTEQVRGIAKVVTAVASGDLKQNFTVQSKGEVAALADTINSMTRTLATFAEQVTSVAREVGVEGRLGGQANVPGAAGTWKDLTGNVNLLAANLTTQVRAIAEVATAVTQGDLTRSIQVEARGEVAELKDNVNTMIDNLRLTTDRNTEQDWLKTNLGRFTSMLQGQRDLVRVGTMLLSELAPLVSAHQAVLYRAAADAHPANGDGEANEKNERGGLILKLLASYADDGTYGHPMTLRFGEGLVGQCAVEKRRILIASLPADTVRIASGLFRALPRTIVVLPVLFEGQIKAVIELASLGAYTASHLAFLDQLTSSIGIVLNSIEATMQTEALLAQSQKLAAELQGRQKELQQTNEQLGQKAQQLADQNAEVERKNQEIEQARRALEDKAEELALTSKYKSEFLANMSHELRTPLNSILILGQQLSENPEQNLSPKQVEFARTIHGAGTDLLNLISDILDLSKIESGTVTVEPAEVFFPMLLDTVARPFRHDAETRGLAFDVRLDPKLGRSLVTDPKRLQQVLKNLLSNAFKFTERGGVRLSISEAPAGWSPEHPILRRAETVVAFEVADTGIGIAPEKQKIIFEAFQQADAGTSRRYGGTGLGLAISRELSNLLGGEMQIRSTPSIGSTFTLYLPREYIGPSVPSRETARRGYLPSDAAIFRTAHADPQDAPALLDAGGEPPPAEPTRQGAWQSADPAEPLGEAAQLEQAKLLEEELRGRHVLVVDDDVRNIFALGSVLERYGMSVVTAQTGREAISILVNTPGIDIALMDIMMPEMDGYQTIRLIREAPDLRRLPIVALTAKAMKGDREKCLDAGASDYLAKPVDTAQLLATLRLWLRR
ncbi:HAMP domain-containing protein [Pendulispora albinea]|uniref:histidine kinase n=1 Tax=Pendulispora albinea TaxID=2741071 RepID=A0ABZ2LMT3_9BACT